LLKTVSDFHLYSEVALMASEKICCRSMIKTAGSSVLRHVLNLFNLHDSGFPWHAIELAQILEGNA